MRLRSVRVPVFLLSLVLLLGYALPWLLALGDEPLRFDEASTRISRRAAWFTANVEGRLGRQVSGLDWRINGGPWTSFAEEPPYVLAPRFKIELFDRELRPGKNRLELRPRGPFGSLGSFERLLVYDPEPPQLPLVQDWSEDLVEIAHGQWEVCEVEGERRARIRPGTTGYDRLPVIAGAFEGGRRVSMTVTLRSYKNDKGRFWGFGPLPLWGAGRSGGGTGSCEVGPSAWSGYYSHRGGVGQEFSHKLGEQEPHWVGHYRNQDIQLDVPQRIVSETWPARDAEGRPLHWKQRMKWWAEGSPEPEHWMELTDTLPRPLDQEIPYGVSFVAYRCQVELGPVRVERVSR